SAAQLFGQYSAGLNNGLPRVMGAAPGPSEQLPNWSSLFGSPDFCACSDCLSVLSPAAYLVDLLNQFADAYISNGGGKKGAELIFARRPDINTLQLSCENTNTTLPYIDLVNELLEDAVSPGTAQPHDSTDGDTGDLGAAPEYLNQEAYTVLAGELFPWTLPFDLGLSQARSYLGDLNVQRFDLMHAFMASPGAADPTDAALTNGDAAAMESLGLSALGWKAITGATGKQPWELWGVSQPDWQNIWTRPAPGPTVQQFLTQSGLAFQDLVDLLESRYCLKLAPAPKQIQIQWADGESCDLTQATILNLSEAILAGLLCFLRLRNALGASVLDTDKLVSALAPAQFDGPFVRQAAEAGRLRSSLSISWPEMASWWGAIPTFPDSSGGTSLYQRLFLNPAIMNPPDANFALNAAGTDLADTSHYLEDLARRPSILAGLQVAASDYALLLAALPLQAGAGGHKLNLANLSELYRATSAARALGLSVADFLTLAKVLNLSFDPSSAGPLAPFNGARVGDATSMLNHAGLVKSSGFSLAELYYL
ncbi:MAG TPA: Tc toxin subunit A, partial [Chthonomonadales bacterium]|nr:Tc toxin subunit A [Chthonomonadales bacterium]